jgi:cytochrome b
VPIEDDKGLTGQVSAIAVWDLPIRLFHWGLVALIGFSWWSAETHHTQWHMWSGFGVLFAVLFRIAWGLVGSSTARFASFVRGPRGLMRYFGDTRAWTAVGHSPLGALSVVAMILVLAAQVGFGLILIDEDGEFSGPLAHLVDDQTNELARTTHHALFNVVLGLIALHVAAILYYRIVKRRRLIGAMIRGSSREYSPGTTALVAGKPLHLILCLVIAAALTAWIVAGAPPF